MQEYSSTKLNESMVRTAKCKRTNRGQYVQRTSFHLACLLAVTHPRPVADPIPGRVELCLIRQLRLAASIDRPALAYPRESIKIILMLSVTHTLVHKQIHRPGAPDGRNSPRRIIQLPSFASPASMIPNRLSGCVLATGLLDPAS